MELLYTADRCTGRRGSAKLQGIFPARGCSQVAGNRPRVRSADCLSSARQTRGTGLVRAGGVGH